MDLINNQKAFFQFSDEFKEPYQKNLALRLHIKETGSLLLDPNVLHPFVRVHVVDMNTCKYLAKSDSNQPGIANKESCHLMDREGNIQEKSPDFIMPVATRFFDMRIKGQN